MLKERGVHYEPKEEDEDFDEEEGYETMEWRVCWHINGYELFLCQHKHREKRKG